MFTQHDKLFEKVKYIVSNSEMALKIENAKTFETQKGVAFAKTFTYSTKFSSIQYTKWIVECFNTAQQMQLPGYELHDKLLHGPGVSFLDKKTGKRFKFYQQEAADIINELESRHMIEILTLTNNLQK